MKLQQGDIVVPIGCKYPKHAHIISDPETLEAYPMGGGFNCRLKLGAWQKVSDGETQANPMVPGKFQIDCEPVFDGYHNRTHWNGWATPWFTKEVSDQIMTWMEENGGMWEFDPGSNTYTVREPGVTDGEPYRITGEHVKIGDSMVMLYPIGTQCWTWSEL